MLISAGQLQMTQRDQHAMIPTFFAKHMVDVEDVYNSLK
jgi:hypothetical protein